MSPFSNSSTRAAVAVTVIVATAVVTVATNSIRKNNSNRNQRLESKSNRNLLHRNYFPSGLSCNLFMKDVAFGPTSTDPVGYSVDEWFCELPEEVSDRFGLEYPSFFDIVDSELVIPSGTQPGRSILFANEASIDLAERTLYIPTRANVTVEHRQQSRKLSRTRGILDLLVIRITDSKGVAPDADLDQLRNDIFKDSASLKTQFEACSYGKLRINPFSGTTQTNQKITHGLVDITVDHDVNGPDGGSRVNIQEASIAAAGKALGSLRDQFDLIMFCMPPGSGKWLAYAFVDDKFSFYNNKWCSYVSGHLHEIGHNLGLAHSGEGSGEGEEAYLDQQGMMGLAYGQDDIKMCYNPAKNYQLGWYNDKVRSIYPLSQDEFQGIGESRVAAFTMNGVSDYKSNDSALIVLRLEQPSSGKDYYIGYNRKDGINADTHEDGDRITIVRKDKGLPDEFGKSTKIASLDPGESYTLRNYDGQFRRVKITFVGLMNENATIEVTEVVKTATPATSTKSTKKSKAGIPKTRNLPCAPHRVEVVTGLRPNDYKWFILEDSGIGRVHATSPTYTAAETMYTSNVCLPFDNGYNLVIKFGDGTGPEGAILRFFDPEDNLIFSGDSRIALSSGVKTLPFIVSKKPVMAFSSLSATGTENYKMTSLETGLEKKTVTQHKSIQKKKVGKRIGSTREANRDSCEDLKKTPFHWDKVHRRLTCRQISRRDKCDIVWFQTQKPLWHVCQKSCNKCGEKLI